MSRLHGLKAFINQRLTAAVEDILGHFERTITEYEEEMDCRHRELLRAASATQMKLHVQSDVKQPLETEEEQEWNSSLDKEHPELPHIKEEQEDLWTSQAGEPLQGLEEAGITIFTFTPVKSKEEEVQSSQLHQIQTEQMKTEGDGEECRGPDSGPVTVEKTGDSSEPQTNLCDDTSKHQSSLYSINKGDVPVDNVEFNESKKSFICCECGRTFCRKDSLLRHMRFHTGEKPYGCSACGKGFSQRPNLIRHMRCHSGEKPFRCSFCDASFAVRGALMNHLRIHTGEKPFSCLYCDKSFTQKGGLKKHMTVHTGEKPFGCPVCDKTFAQKANLTYHFSLHTGQKQFSCGVCDKRFTWQSQVRSHKCVGLAIGN